MRLEKAIAASLAIHLLLTGAFAISQGLKRCNRKPAPEAVFAELVPPAAAAPRAVEVPPPVENIAEKPMPAGDPAKPAAPAATATAPDTESAAMPELPATPPASAAVQPATPAQPAAVPPAPAAKPPSTLASAAVDTPVPASDNVPATGAPPSEIDFEQIRRARMHHQAVVSTDAFYRLVPAELSRIVNDVLAGGTLLSQGDALIHMEVTPSGQVGRAHVQANSSALLNRLERIEWTESLPPRPLAACNAIHLRISVVGDSIQVRVELL